MIPAAKFGVRAPNKETFVQSWIDAGIWTAPHEYTAEYQGIFCNMDTWPGIIEGIDGWHTNVIVYGQPLLAEFTYQLDQYDDEGNLKSIWDRTWASAIFNLTWQEEDLENRFPAGYRNDIGIMYADSTVFKSPSNIILT